MWTYTLDLTVLANWCPNLRAVKVQGPRKLNAVGFPALANQLESVVIINARAEDLKNSFQSSTRLRRAVFVGVGHFPAEKDSTTLGLLPPCLEELRVTSTGAFVTESLGNLRSLQVLSLNGTEECNAAAAIEMCIGTLTEVTLSGGSYIDERALVALGDGLRSGTLQSLLLGRSFDSRAVTIPLASWKQQHPDDAQRCRLEKLSLLGWKNIRHEDAAGVAQLAQRTLKHLSLAECSGPGIPVFLGLCSLVVELNLRLTVGPFSLTGVAKMRQLRSLDLSQNPWLSDDCVSEALVDPVDPNAPCHSFLETISLSFCPALTSVVALGCITSLTDVSLRGCPAILDFSPICNSRSKLKVFSERIC